MNELRRGAEFDFIIVCSSDDPEREVSGLRVAHRESHRAACPACTSPDPRRSALALELGALDLVPLPTSNSRVAAALWRARRLWTVRAEQVAETPPAAPPGRLGVLRNHAWARLDGERAVVGLLDMHLRAVSDLTGIELPPAGTSVLQGARLGRLLRSDGATPLPLRSPVTGVVTATECSEDLDVETPFVALHCTDPAGDRLALSVW